MRSSTQSDGEATNTARLTSTNLTGLGMGADDVTDTSLGIEYSNLERFEINLGDGIDQFDVRSTNGSTISVTGDTLTTVNTGLGTSNTINVAGKTAACRI